MKYIRKYEKFSNQLKILLQDQTQKMVELSGDEEHLNNINNSVVVGDYVIIVENSLDSEEWNRFINNSVAKVISVDDSSLVGKYSNDIYKNTYEIEFKLPDTYLSHKEFLIKRVYTHQILFSSSNKEECEIYLTSKKYNL